MLDKQIHMHSVDTGHFYSNREKYLHNMNCKYRSEKNYVLNKIAFFDNVMKEYGYKQTDLSHIKSGKFNDVDISSETSGLIYEYFYWHSIIKHKRKKAKNTKNELALLLKNKVNQNEKTKGKDHTRFLSEDDINDKNIISVFDSSLTRAIGIEENTFTDALIIVQIYYFDIFKDISFNGFKYKDNKYRYFTSSAGQIRKKKAVFIKETVWSNIHKTIMCGLTIEKINEKGGNNVNKHLAYLALSNSATDEWKGFNIDKCIVIDDFETDVSGTYDFIDETNYSITRKTDYVPLTHTDGAGMMLPSVSSKNFMFRTPWIKGLLGVFDFKKFITVNHYSPIIVDIYGKEYNVITDDIQIILTKSQFKMYKYYESWDEYKSYYKKYKCTSGICNIEEERVKNAKINYQMLQTITNITDTEVNMLIKKSKEKIDSVCNSKETMLNILGVTPYNINLNPFQKAVKIYPSLLCDTYSKDVIREVKDSLLKKYRSGKLEVFGKYTFLLPDFYAACEYWFGRVLEPKGLLSDKEVFCDLFKKHDKLDCLRSPHLFKEHAIRFNVASDVYENRSNLIREWFTTGAIYTSIHDLISKILMFDVDGDSSLVVADKDYVRIAERNMNGIVPLYYNMRKADPTQLNKETIYDGLNAAFTHGNIGIYSNDISKIWNNEVFNSGTEEEQNEAMDVIKLLCMENNFCIDSAKTLYMPERVGEFKEKISKYTKYKLPAFFEFAKDKDNSQIESRNNSFVNKLFDSIPNKPINTKGLKLDKLNYHLLMSNVNTICSREVSDLYMQLNKKYRYMINMKDEYVDNLMHVANKLRDEFTTIGYSPETITDMLIHYLYGSEKRYKQLLWFCYGKYIVQNLEKNIVIKDTKFIQCIDCDEWVEVAIKDNETTRCHECYLTYRRKYKAEMEKLRRYSRKSKNVDSSNQ